MAYIYHEKQDSLLCGQHCINNLLQGPYFNAVDLSEIAIDLDQQEHNLLQNTASRLSDNVDESGNFSIQVLKYALQRFNRIQLDPINPSIMMNFDPLKESGFIFNISSHWFTIRKINNHWWNLNSSNQSGPQYISPFYLSAYIHELLNAGHSVFIAKGEIPTTSSPTLFGGSIQDSNNWYIESELLKQQSSKSSTTSQPIFTGKGKRLGGDDNGKNDNIDHKDFIALDGGELDEDLLLAQAISASLETQQSTITSKEEMRMKRLLALEKK